MSGTCLKYHQACACTNFQLEILIRSTVSGMHIFGQDIWESSRNVSETSPDSFTVTLRGPYGRQIVCHWPSEYCRNMVHDHMGSQNTANYPESSAICLFRNLYLGQAVTQLATSANWTPYFILQWHFSNGSGKVCGWHTNIFHSAVIWCIQYIPRNVHTVLLCFALLWLCNRS